MSAITDMMSNTELVVDDGAAGPLEKLLSHIYQLELVINDVHFVCHAFPFPLKSSYFRAAIQSFKTSSSSNTDLRINLSNLPGGCQAFKSIRSFCYDSRITITTENVLDLLSASKFLGFTEDIARDNLYKQCQSFLEMESIEHGVPGIFTMLKYSTTDESFVRDYEFLFKAIAKQALAYQDTDDAERRHKIFGLLLELAKLKPWFVDATLQEFDRLGVYMIEFFWHKDLPSSLNILLTDEEGLCTNKRSICSYFVRNLDVCIDARAVAIGVLDPKKLVKLVLAPPQHKGSLKSESVIKAYVASQLGHLEATDIRNLPREVILELVSASRKKHLELQHLGGVIDQVLLEEAQECPWDGSLDSKLKFQQLADCIDRPSHDTLHDAVACFARLFPPAEATELWSMIDTEKLSSSKLDSAISLSLSQESSFTARLLRRLTDEHNSLKRKLSSLEKRETKRRSLDCRRSEFTIFVRALDGRTLCVLVQSHTTVFSIMEGIKHQGNIQCRRPWCLTYQQKNLNETLPIASYGIEKDCTLCMKVLYAGDSGQPIWDEDLQGSR